MGLKSLSPLDIEVSERTTAATATIDHNAYFLSSIVLIFLGPGLGGFLYGYDIGATSFAIESLKSFWEQGDDENDSTWRIGVFVATPSIAAFVGSLIIFPFADYISKRQELIYGSILYMTGALWQAAPSLLLLQTPEKQPNDAIYWFGFICGRFVYGLGIGLTMHGAPAYLGEMLPYTIRGPLLSLKEAFIVLGMLSGYIFGYALEKTLDGWAYAYVWSLVVSITMFVILQFLPYSYRWLVSHGRSDEALVSLRFVYRPGYAEEQYEELIKSTSSIINNTELQQRQEGVVRLSNVFASCSSLFHSSRRSSLLAGYGLVILQQITGQPSIMSYATPIFTSIGLASTSSVLVGFFKLFATSMTILAVERYGRKRLLYIGCYLMLLALTILFSVHVDGTTQQEKGATSRNMIILIAMFLYIGGYQVGFGPITWLMMAEIFPLSIRGQAVAVAVQLNFFLNSIVQFGVPLLEKALGLSNTFGLFGIITAYSIYFIHYHVLETKGLTLEEIETKYNNTTTNNGKKTAYPLESTIDTAAEEGRRLVMPSL